MRRPKIHRSHLRRIAAAAIFLSAVALACSRQSKEVADASVQSAVGRGAAGAPVAVSAPAAPATEGEAASVGFAQAARSAPIPTRAASFGATAMLIRTGTASVQVDSLDRAIARVREVAQRVGGVVANVDMQTGNEQNRSASLELRVPADRFDDAVSGLAPIGKVEAVNVSVEDVGEEFVDVTARVANARKLEDRLVQLLATRTGKLGDVLMVERELARVREEIERYEGRLRYLSARTATSRLTVTLHEPLPLVATHPGEHPIRDAFKQAWRNFVALTAGIVASLGIVIPIGLVALGGWLALRAHAPRFGKGDASTE